MVIYTGTKESFRNDSMNGVIADKLDSIFTSCGIRKESKSEYRSWEQSLIRISAVINHKNIDDKVPVAVEYQIPLTSKRVDFMIGGSDGQNDNIVVVELKQWEDCQETDKENIVSTFIGGAPRLVVHPSQQAYSYTTLIENFNESVRENKIRLFPCAYLHNFKDKNRHHIISPLYEEAIKDAPLFIQPDSTLLSQYIASKVVEPSKLDLFNIVEYGKLKPSKSLQSVIGSILNGNNEFSLIDEQLIAYATVLKYVQNNINDDNKHTIIIQGGPGTGKSVIAINLLAKIINNGYSCAYVTKNSAPRHTFSKSLIKGEHTLCYLKGLFKSSGSFVDTQSNTFHCLIVDEAHRLMFKSGMYHNYGENQIKEIINSSRISVFFIDEDQIVTMGDIGTIDEIKKQAELLDSKVHTSKSLILTSQFRCNGSDGYIAFLDDVLQIRETANAFYLDNDYDFRVFDDPCEMREELRKYNTNNKARMIAGYCYPWNSKYDKKAIDIELPKGFKAQWNFTTDEFATDPNSFEQVGCIHSTQGLEFEYTAVIIGNDLRYENNKVITDYTKRYLRRDKTITTGKAKSNPELADRIIRNTYKTIMSRGLKGCFVYCEDSNLSQYLKKRLELVNKYKEKHKIN